MKRKNCLIRCLEQLTCDKHELNRFIIKIKKRLDEACAALGDKKKR